MPIPSQAEHFLTERHFEWAKVGIATLLALLLMYVGFRGRQHARLQIKVEDIMAVSDQLQQKLEDEPAERPMAGVQGTNIISRQRHVSTAQVRALANNLRDLLGQFDSDYNRAKLPEAESAQMRLSEAILANAEGHFSEALSMLPEGQGKAAARGINGRLSEVQADSYYGLQQWQKALDHYQAVLAAEPDRIAMRARVANCQYALGRLKDAVSTEVDLARRRNDRGNALLLERKADLAIAQFEKAIEIKARLIEQGGEGDLADSYNHRGDAFLVQRKLDDAVRDYNKAIEIAARLGSPKSQQALAKSISNRGNAYLLQGKAEAAIAEYEKANEILARLPEGQSERTSGLARNYNNRGVVRRAQGKVDASLGDFEKAIEMTRETEQSKLTGGSWKRSTGTVELDVAIGCSEKVIDPVMRLRMSEQEGEEAVVLGMSLRNRGYAYLVQGKLKAAREDFEKAAEIYARLVNREGQRDLVLELARSMGAIGWIYATHPDDSARDARKAKDYALEACQLSEWKALAPVETLAAACAAVGDFRSAVQWQQKAVELAPGKYKDELRNRLELYKSGSVYRMKQAG